MPLVPIDAQPAPPKILRSRDGKTLYRALRAGPMEALEQITPDAGPALIRWHGARISADVWRSVSSFLHWSQRETHSEALIYLALCDHEQPAHWVPWVPAQRAYSGMSVAPLPDHELTAAARAQLPAHNGGIIVSAHHHCRAAAFQSSTDSADELGKTGLHVTLGDMEDARHGLHSRVIFERTQTEAVLSDWFELPPELEAAAAVAPHLRDDLLLAWLTTPQPVECFPAEWKSQLIRPLKIETTGYSPYQSSALPAHYQESCRQSEDRADELQQDLRRIAADYQIDLQELSGWIGRLDTFALDMIGAMIDGHSQPWETANMIDDLVHARTQTAETAESAYNDGELWQQYCAEGGTA